ncbi:MAG TPA: PQQ-dependent sugar dehydrogenase [Solirubrobacterales bacterium]|nr:PQQ-dependent sugar dehydrogenase [Solirubrobacterales bacterium]
MRRLTIAIALAAIATIALNVGFADAKPRLKLKRVGRFQSPTYVTSAPGVAGAVIVERGGRIRLLQARKRPTFTDIGGSVSTGGERGLLSVAFSPDYAASRLLYVYFTNGAGDLVIAEMRADPDGRHADPATLRPIVVIPHPNQSNHNGGQLQFGPDGLLYAATGDGGGAGDQPDNAQNPSSRLGKLLQIDPASGAVRVYALGFRNPYRFSFDLVSAPGQPRLAIADVGQDRFDEIDYLPLAAAAGANFGWNDFEGFAPFSGAHPPTPSGTVKPIKVRSISGAGCAIIGGYVVRDRKLRTLFHRYVYGDFCTGQIRSLIPRLGGARKDRGTGLRVRNLSSFGETANGKLFATSLDGPVYRIAPRRR